VESANVHLNNLPRPSLSLLQLRPFLYISSLLLHIYIFVTHTHTFTFGSSLVSVLFFSNLEFFMPCSSLFDIWNFFITIKSKFY
jgi:hypothetical protein